jgi:hypothetical protein
VRELEGRRDEGIASKMRNILITSERRRSVDVFDCISNAVHGATVYMVTIRIFWITVQGKMLLEK